MDPPDYMSYKLEKVVEPVTLGEAPHWHAESEALYFISTYDHTIHKYVPATGVATSSKLDGRTTFIIPIEGKPDRFLVGVERKVVELEWDGTNDAAVVVRVVTEVDKNYPDNRLNDAKADPRGRLFAGTMGGEYAPGKFHLKRGVLYLVAASGEARALADRLDICNGLCWDLNEKAFYFADSFEYAIRRYDYDVDTGDISNPKIIFAFSDHGLAGIPDGMTIDTDGNLWLANFDNALVLKIDPRSGTILDKITIPAQQVTSVTFGGRSLDELFVTTGCVDRGSPPPPPSGATFRLTGLGVKGHPNISAKF